jgi:hypothetical protein
MKPIAFALALAAASGASPAMARVTESSERGFVVRHVAEVPASAADAWDMLLKPSEWWDPEHTWSGSAANMSIDPRAGGCFCEMLPNPDSPRAAPRGSVEHMRVIFVERPRALRMTGLLGPLQAEAASGTMTILLKPAAKGAGTRIQLEYVVGGYLRMSHETIAPAVDGVLGAQIRRLADKLGGAIEVDEAAGGQASRQTGERAGPEMTGL